VLDEGSLWTPPASHYIVNIDEGQGGIFWSYDPATQVWTAPPDPADVVWPTVT